MLGHGLLADFSRKSYNHDIRNERIPPLSLAAIAHVVPCRYMLSLGSSYPDGETIADKNVSARLFPRSHDEGGATYS